MYYVMQRMKTDYLNHGHTDIFGLENRDALLIALRLTFLRKHHSKIVVKGHLFRVWKCTFIKI